MSNGKAKVLVQQDNDSLRSSINRLLSNCGHLVTAVKTGAEALQHLKGTTFDVIVRDSHRRSFDSDDVSGKIMETLGTVDPQADATVISLHSIYSLVGVAVRDRTLDTAMLLTSSPNVVWTSEQFMLMDEFSSNLQGIASRIGAAAVIPTTAPTQVLLTVIANITESKPKPKPLLKAA